MLRLKLVLIALISLLTVVYNSFIYRVISIFLAGVLGFNSLTGHGYLWSITQANAAIPSAANNTTNIFNRDISQNICIPFVGCKKAPLPGGIENTINQSIKNEVYNALRNVISSEVPIVGTTDHKLYPNVDQLPGKPFAPKLLNLADLEENDVVPYGDYEIPSHFYCTKVYTFNGSGNRYILGKLNGKMSDALSLLYLRASQSGTPTNDVQVLSWSIQTGVPYNKLSQREKTLVNELIPEYRDKMDVGFYEKLTSTWNDISRLTKLPSFNTVLNDLGNLGDLAKSLLSAREEILRSNFSYRPLANSFVIPKDANLSGDSSQTPWSQLHEQFYLRFVAPKGALNDGFIQIRILEPSTQNKSWDKQLKIANTLVLPPPIAINPWVIGGILVLGLTYYIVSSVGIPVSAGHQAITTTLTMASTGNGGGGNQRPPRKICQTAEKLLTQYERLADKQGSRIGGNRLAELNRLRDLGQITVNDLPAKLRAVFPGQFNNMTLQQIRNLCGR